MGFGQADWRQGWWWREKLPAVIGIFVAVLLCVTVGWGVFWLNRDEHHSPNYGRATDTPTTSAQPPSSTEKPPTLPPEAKEQTSGGIVATIKFENDALNYLQRTGDDKPLRQIYDLDSCDSCSLLIKTLSWLPKHEKHLEGADYHIQNIVVAISPDPNAKWPGTAFYSSEQTEDYFIVNKDGKKIEKRNRQKLTKFSDILKFSDRWIIVSSDVVK
ncbi:MAG TPA: DUF6318 family protein [Mycobacteriales bacterium]|jgi:hypothetical protein|nr:DUF6318 family protein [Mycobacteriales bacterium]